MASTSPKLAADYDGRTPLHLAAAEGHEELVSYLIAQKVNEQPDDRSKQTPQAEAKSAGHESIIGRLEDAIRAGKDDPIKPDPSFSAESRTKRDRSRTKLAQFEPTLASAPEQLEIIWASAEGDLETIRRHVARGNSLNIRDYDDRTPLHLATAQAKIDVVAFLVSCHIDSLGSMEDARAARLSWPDRWGRTPLDEATDPRVFAHSPEEEAKIRAGLEKCIELLKDGGAVLGADLFASE